MSSKDNQKGDIEIIPPDRAGERHQQREWIHISFGPGSNVFQNLPWHKRALYALAGLAGALIFGTIVFLVLASTILIWIPLILAVGTVITVVALVRSRFLRR